MAEEIGVLIVMGSGEYGGGKESDEETVFGSWRGRMGPGKEVS